MGYPSESSAQEVCGLVREGRSDDHDPCTVEDPAISLYCRPRALAWRAPLHIRAVCEPRQTLLCGSRNAVEEESFVQTRKPG